MKIWFDRLMAWLGYVAADEAVRWQNRADRYLQMWQEKQEREIVLRDILEIRTDHLEEANARIDKLERENSDLRSKVQMADGMIKASIETNQKHVERIRELEKSKVTRAEYDRLAEETRRKIVGGRAIKEMREYRKKNVPGVA